MIALHFKAENTSVQRPLICVGSTHVLPDLEGRKAGIHIQLMHGCLRTDNSLFGCLIVDISHIRLEQNVLC